MSSESFKGYSPDTSSAIWSGSMRLRTRPPLSPTLRASYNSTLYPKACRPSATSGSAISLTQLNWNLCQIESLLTPSDRTETWDAIQGTHAMWHNDSRCWTINLIEPCGNDGAIDCLALNQSVTRDNCHLGRYGREKMSDHRKSGVCLSRLQTIYLASWTMIRKIMIVLVTLNGFENSACECCTADQMIADARLFMQHKVAERVRLITISQKSEWAEICSNQGPHLSIVMVPFACYHMPWEANQAVISDSQNGTFDIMISAE